MDFEKLKQKIANFDLNAAVASVVSGAASMGTEGYIAIGYFLVSVVATLFTLKQSNKKAQRDDEMRLQEIRLKEAEVESKIIENKLKAKTLNDGTQGN